MKFLSQLVHRKGDATIFVNIQLAAMSLHRILDRRTDISFSFADELQDLATPQEGPSNILWVFRMLIYPELFFTPVHRLNEESLTEEEQETLRPILAQSDKLDTPLRLALFVSPLCLLLPKSLHKSRNDNSRITAVGL
jgi:hypothetical protein